MQTVSKKDRHAAVVQFLALGLAVEQEQVDEADAELFASIARQLTGRRKGVVSSGLIDLTKRRESIEATIRPESATNLALHALDCIAAGAHMDNRRLANSLREIRQKLLNMMSDSKVAPPPFTPETKKRD